MSKNLFVFLIYRDCNSYRIQTIKIAINLKYIYIILRQIQTTIMYIEFDLNFKKYNNLICNDNRMLPKNQLKYILRNLKLKEFYVRYY